MWPEAGCRERAQGLSSIPVHAAHANRQIKVDHRLLDQLRERARQADAFAPTAIAIEAKRYDATSLSERDPLQAASSTMLGTIVTSSCASCAQPPI